MTHIPPQVLAKKFTCPHCGAIAHQEWEVRDWAFRHLSRQELNVLRVGQCTHCEKHTLWLAERMYFPDTGTAPSPNPEMPSTVSGYYCEAASIQTKSPRGAAALLRLAIQKLCVELGESGQNINDDIASLVKKGLPAIVQQSLDVVRVTGNNAIHPGQIDADDPEVVGQLFALLNIIVEYMIAMPNKVSGMYANLPTAAREAIKKRDG